LLFILSLSSELLFSFLLILYQFSSVRSKTVLPRYIQIQWM